MNATSLQAIAYIASIRNDVTAAVTIASDSLVFAENASYIAGNLSSVCTFDLADTRAFNESSGSEVNTSVVHRASLCA